MAIDISKIASVYSGANGKCCCGCSGTHRYANAYRNERPSYIDHNSDEWVNDKQVKRVVAKLEQIGYEDEDYGFVGVDHSSGRDGRLYIAYKAKDAQQPEHDFGFPREILN